MELGKYKLTPKHSHQIYEKEVSRTVFGNAEGNAENPRMIIVAGQPGAGKSTVLNQASAELKNAVTINTDDLRQFHPHEKELYKLFGKESSSYTHEEASKWSKQLREDAIDKRYNIILENTLSNEKSVTNTINTAKSAGYDITVKVLAVNELVSQYSVYRRYENQLKVTEKDPKTVPRFTPLDYHDQAYKSMVTTVERIEKEKLAKVEVFDREGNRLYLDPKKNIDSAAAAIMEVRNTPWSIEQYQNYITQNKTLMKHMMERGEKPEHVEIISKLNEKAETKISANDRQIYNQIQAIQKEPPIKLQSSNPHSRDTYMAYIQDDMKNISGIWTKQTDFRIAKNMMTDGLRPQAIKAALHHSPGLAGMGPADKSNKIKEIMTEIGGLKLQQNLEFPRRK